MPIQQSPPFEFDTGARVQPRQLYRWCDVSPQNGRLQRTRGYITLPTFSIVNTWLGYSDIVVAFNFTCDHNFCLKSFITLVPLNPNYALFIMWIDSTNTVHRRALWQDVGEVIYSTIPDYTNEVVGKNFRLEVWSTNNTPIVSNDSITFYTSVLGNQDYRYGSDFPLSAALEITNFKCLTQGFSQPFTADNTTITADSLITVDTVNIGSANAFPLPLVFPAGSVPTINT